MIQDMRSSYCSKGMCIIMYTNQRYIVFCSDTVGISLGNCIGIGLGVWHRCHSSCVHNIS